MTTPNEIAANLPPPRDDEPTSLRQDIFDELADHLECALDREQQRQSAFPETSESPRERTLKRFGNPAQIALGLWWDAMWGKIMTQRIVITLSSLVAVACCAAVFVSMRLVGIQERALTDQRAAFEAMQQGMLAQQKELAETLQRIRDQSQAAAQAGSETPAEWVPAVIRCLGPDGETPAPAGLQVVLASRDKDSRLPPWKQVTNGRDPIRIPKVRYGHYGLSVAAPWGDSLITSIGINPGLPFELDLRCPAGPPETVVIKPVFELPDDLNTRDLYFNLPLGTTRRVVGSEKWETSLPIQGRESNWTILVSRRGTLHPMTARADVEPYLAYDDAGDLLGIRWPAPNAIPRYPGVYLAKRLGGGGSGSSEAEAPLPPGATTRLFELRNSSELNDEVELGLDADGHRAAIRLKPAALSRLRQALQQFDQNSYALDTDGSLVSDPWRSEKDAILRPSIPEKRS